MRKCRRSWTSAPVNASITRSQRCWSPSACGHHSGGSATSTDHSTRFSPSAAWWLWTCSVPATRVRRSTGPPPGTSSTARSSSRARGSSRPSPVLTSAQTARAWRMATRPVDRSRTGRHTPPTIRSSTPHSSGSCNAPVSSVRCRGRRSGGRWPRWPASARTGGELLGHLQLVGHEVPVGVAQIGAVEPDVPLLGQPLDPQPPAPAAALDGIVSPVASVPDGGCGLAPGRILGPGCDRLRRSLEAVAVQHRLLEGEVRALVVRCGLRPMAGTGIVVQRESSWSNSWKVRRRPSVAAAIRHVPPRSTVPSYRPQLLCPGG